VGYIDSPDSLPISAQLAATRLANPQTTAEMRAIDDAKKAAKKAKDDAEWAKVHEEYLKNLDKSVDPKVVEENLRRNRVESGSGLSETEQLKKGCQVTHLLYDDKRISDLTPKQLQMLQFCGVLGY
jgi:DNA-binding GntR family transcriptional regulator